MFRPWQPPSVQGFPALLSQVRQHFVSHLVPLTGAAPKGRFNAADNREQCVPHGQNGYHEVTPDIWRHHGPED